MSGGPIQVYNVGIASGASTSSYVDLGGKSYTQWAVNYVTMSTGALVSVLGSVASTGPFQPILVGSKVTSVVQYNALTIPTTTSGGWAVFDAIPIRYIEFITSAIVSGGVSFTVTAQD